MSYVNGKIDLTPRRHHAWAVLLFILGTLLPPLAVAARFGIGSDFFLNVILTICGYIPGHMHNFYIQNIRNNKNHRRTPKWAQKFGLVDTSTIERHKKRSQWASRYNDRLPHSALEGQEYAEGEVPGGSRPDSLLEPDARARRDEQRFWNEQEERYYGQGQGQGGGRRSSGSLDDSVSGSTSGGRWHYPANFADTLPSAGGDDVHGGGKKKKKKSKKDRWARTEDAYSAPPPKKRKSKRSKGRSAVADGGDEMDRSSAISLDETSFPEDAEGGLYGEQRRERENGAPKVPAIGANGRPRDELDHDF